MPFGKEGYLALSDLSQERNVDLRQNIDDAPQGVRTSQWAYFATYSRKFEWFDLGMNLKYIDLRLYDYTAAESAQTSGSLVSSKGL